MATSAANVVVGITGAAYVGLTSATAPTSSSSALTGFNDLGYLSADGIEVSSDMNTSAIRAWQNSDLVRESVTESTLTYKFTLLETTAETVKLYFGSTPASSKVSYNPSSTGGRKSFVFDIVDGSTTVRHYVPTGEVMKVEPIAVKNGEPVSYGITVVAYALNGRCADVFFSALS